MPYPYPTSSKQRGLDMMVTRFVLCVPRNEFRATLARFAGSALAALALLIALLAAAPASAATQSFSPVADTYTRSDQPSTNFGTSNRFSAQASSPRRQSYLRFDVGIPTGSIIKRATLRLGSVTTGGPTGIELRSLATDAWSETTLNYSNAPALGSTVASTGSYSGDSWIGLDAASLVKERGLVSMGLTTAGTSYHGFHSRESANDPQLVVEYDSPPAPSPPPAGALHSTASEPFVAADGKPVRLQGFNVSPVWSDKPGQTWDAARYQQIRDRGFNAVRLVLKWSDFEPTRGAFQQTHLTTLDTAIARAKAAGLYVILDEIHLYGSGGFSYVPSWAKTGDSVTSVETNGAGYLKLLAGRYRSDPAVAAYDPVNEFHRWPIDQNGVLRAYDRLIREIRTVVPN